MTNFTNVMSASLTLKRTSVVNKDVRLKNLASKSHSLGDNMKASRSKTSSRSRSSTSKNSDHSLHISLGAYRGSLLFRVDKTGFKVPKYQNTYCLTPYNPYKCEVVDKILSNVMHASMSNVKYDPENCMQVCQDVTAEVRSQIFKKNYDRYKFIILVSLIQKLGQHVHIDFGRLWDAERDTYSTCTVETPEFIAVGLVAAVYYE